MQNNPHSSSLHRHAWQFVSGVWFSPITTLCVIDFVTAVLWFVQRQVCIWTKITCPAMLFLKKTGFLLAAFLNKTLHIFSFFLILLLWTLVFNMLAEAHKVRDMGFGYLQFLWALLRLTLLGCQLPQRCSIVLTHTSKLETTKLWELLLSVDGNIQWQWISKMHFISTIC